MTKDLTNSSVHRQNILNNPYALQEIEKATRISGIPFEGKSVVLKEQVAAFFEVTPRTVDNYIEKYGDELRRNGYEVLRGNRLKTLKSEISARGDNETDFVIKTNVLGIPGAGVRDYGRWCFRPMRRSSSPGRVGSALPLKCAALWIDCGS
jgi:hypothetical protein